MPGVFDAAGDQTVTSSFITVAGLTSATTIRPEVCEIKVGASGTPADNALTWLFQRYTGAGTSTGVTPSARDPANDGLQKASFGSNHTSEPTYTASKFPFSFPPLHQKNSFVWQAYSGEGIILPATASNGVGVQVKSTSYTGDVVAGMAWKE